jgi:hypothetical protein
MMGAWVAAARAPPTQVPLVASEHDQMSWPAGDHTPQAREAARRVDMFSLTARRPVGPCGADRPARLVAVTLAEQAGRALAAGTPTPAPGKETGGTTSGVGRLIVGTSGSRAAFRHCGTGVLPRSNA